MDNPCRFWSYHKAITKSSRIPGVIRHGSIEARNLIDKANLFNIFFHSVFSALDIPNALPVINLGYNSVEEISMLRISTDSVERQLKSLNITKASLGVPSKLLHACAEEIAPSLSKLFNMSLELGSFPEKWKDANIVPIHKTRSKVIVRITR